MYRMLQQACIGQEGFTKMSKNPKSRQYLTSFCLSNVSVRLSTSSRDRRKTDVSGPPEVGTYLSKTCNHALNTSCVLSAEIQCLQVNFSLIGMTKRQRRNLSIMQGPSLWVALLIFVTGFSLSESYLDSTPTPAFSRPLPKASPRTVKRVQAHTAAVCFDSFFSYCGL